MTPLSDSDRALVSVIQKGLPLLPRPYEAIARSISMSEQEVIERIRWLYEIGAIKRLGVIVRHHELGYNANAMVVWDVPDHLVADMGRCFSQFEFITLCYQRPRRMPLWRYNLFCMIHGQDRDAVIANLDRLVEQCDVQDIPHDVLFSCRRFKQRGAIYVHNGLPDRIKNQGAG